MKRSTNIHSVVSGILAALPFLILLSCERQEPRTDREQGERCDYICFGIGQEDEGSAAGREGEVSDRFVLRSDGTSDSLWLNASVSGDMPSCFTEDRSLTRAAPVGKDNFYDAFHVMAYWTKGGELQESFFMDEDVTDRGDGVWITGDNTYYWPGEGHSLQFYAYAPADTVLFERPASSGSTLLAGYTVPSKVRDQRDIVVAVTEKISGDNNSAVPLTFRHICTAVSFKRGSDMQPGVIKEISIKGIRNSGDYDMSGEGKWTLKETTADFTLELNKETEGTVTGGEITTAEQTFMMLPQILPEGATVEVLFHDDITGKDRTFSADVKGQEWPMGKSVSYKLSISPDYELEIIIDEENKVQDAHYVSFPITLSVGDITGETEWTLSSNFPEDLFFTPTQTSLQKQGYWIDDDKGNPTVTGKGSGLFTYYVYLTENIADTPRDIELSVNVAGGVKSEKMTQLSPSWYKDDLGCERIEDGDYPYGFKYPEDYTVTYNVGKHWLGPLFRLLLEFFVRENYISMEGLGWKEDIIVNINYSRMPAYVMPPESDDGQKNTTELYNFEGINDTAVLEEYLTSIGAVKTVSGDASFDPNRFAARACAMKNLFRKETTTIDGTLVEKPVLVSMDWYLPAENEAIGLKDGVYPLMGEYWTSTIENDNINAWKLNGDHANTSQEDRLTELHVRAVRKRPTP